MKTIRFPIAHCRFCKHWEACLAKKTLGASIDPTRCYEDMREVDIELLSAHFHALRQYSGLENKALATMEKRLLAHLKQSMRAYSFTLEFSASATGDQRESVSLYRFSYALPQFQTNQRKAAKRAVLSFVEPLNAHLIEPLERLLSLSRLPPVAQTLFGLDMAKAEKRVKLYFHLFEGQAKEKFELLRWILPKEYLLQTPQPYSRLHLIGLDLNDAGVVRVKLYFLSKRIAKKPALEYFGETPLLKALLDAMEEEYIIDFQAIRRIRLDESGSPNAISELDFSLVKNGLGEEALLAIASPVIDACLKGLKNTETKGRVAFNRISISTNPKKEKANLYYLLFG